MTLSIELFQDIIKVNRCTKFRDHTSIRSAVRALTHGHTHRDRTISITSTTDAGGNNIISTSGTINFVFLIFQRGEDLYDGPL